MISKIDEDLIIRTYLQLKSGYKTAEATGFTSRQVYGCLSRNKIPVTPPHQINRKYTADESFFSIIDSHAKAHLLGFWSADGCIYKKRGSKIISIDLSLTDIDYIEYIKRALSYTGPINHQIRAKRPYVRFAIYSQKLFNDLERLGITEKKSLTLEFPSFDKVPKEFIASFICGHFEGDGCIWLRKSDASPYAEINTVGTKSMVENIGKICAEELGVTYTIKQNTGPRQRGVNTWIIKISGNPQVIKVMKWMYANVPYKMMRKYQRYEGLLKYYNECGDFVPDEKWLTQKKERFLETLKRENIDIGKKLRREYYLKSPNGDIYHTWGAKNLSKEIGMSESSLVATSRGKAKCRGWTQPTPSEIDSARAAGTLIERIY